MPVTIHLHISPEFFVIGSLNCSAQKDFFCRFEELLTRFISSYPSMIADIFPFDTNLDFFQDVFLTTLS